MNGRRASRRQKSFLRGVVYFDKRRSETACLVRDLSEDGARIVLSQTITIPDVIELQIPQREQTLSARVQWRRADEVGLSFSKPDTATTAGKSAHQAHRRAQSRNHHAPAHHQASQARQSTATVGSRRLSRNALHAKRLTL